MRTSDSSRVSDAPAVTSETQSGSRSLAHEGVHAAQWFILGPVIFPMMYGAASAVQGKCNVFEQWAGFEDGGYQKY